MMPATVASYDFLAPQRIVFGWGRWPEVGPLAANLGKRAFLVSGSRSLTASGFMTELHRVLGAAGVEAVELASLHREPEVEDVDRVACALRAASAGAGDLVLAVGGGSALDLGKAAAALATNTQGTSVRDYLEGVGTGLTITRPPLPCLAMPTTAGTGSEATKNAVISSYDPHFKKSLRADGMLPRVVLVDPQLSVTVPPAITAQTGMDAITQLIESYISRKARPIPQALAASGLRWALPALVEAVEHGSSRPAREAMAQAALLSGMALANSGLGLAHGVAAALGVHFRLAHGAACALMLGVALRVNRPVCERQLAELARAAELTHCPVDSEAADVLLARIAEISERIGVPARLSDVGVTRESLPALVRDSRGNSMDGNPRTLSDEELWRVLEEHL